ncbi:MAG: hypothetical protein OXF05_05120, partial [Hyphomicrobiales bacterium]|nr:hypothetical protein [Hyphomicrobiales bacterium]
MKTFSRKQVNKTLNRGNYTTEQSGGILPKFSTEWKWRRADEVTQTALESGLAGAAIRLRGCYKGVKAAGGRHKKSRLPTPREEMWSGSPF